jgi:hypothetical protein
MDMTHDDLTPEEREALAGLPRERMPSAGLEDRVVAAMRERGHIAKKPARIIRITNTRVAGLLAACVVLVIGAYSIGLNRGVNREVLRNVEPRTSETPAQLERDETIGGLKPPASDNLARQSAPAANVPEQGFIKKEAPPLELKLNTPRIAVPKDEKKQPARNDDQVTESMQKTFSDGIAQGVPSATDLASPAVPSPAPLRAKATLEEAERPWRTFALNGGTLIVDAPDSVRVVTDAQGRTLLIYTSEGVIRIRLAD